MPHPDWLQKAIDRNPRTAGDRPRKVPRTEIEAEVRLVLERTPRLSEAEILTAVRIAPMLRGRRVSREVSRNVLRALRTAKRGRPKSVPE